MTREVILKEPEHCPFCKKDIEAGETAIVGLGMVFHKRHTSHKAEMEYIDEPEKRIIESLNIKEVEEVPIVSKVHSTQSHKMPEIPSTSRLRGSSYSSRK